MESRKGADPQKLALQAATERTVERLWLRGDLRAAFEATVKAYGPELLGYLVAILRDETSAREAYAELLEQLWKSLPRFQRACSFRTWTYALAFRLAARQRRRTRRRRETSLGAAPTWLLARARSSTARYRRTAARDWLSRARAELGAGDQSLLTLRVDRALSWNDVSTIMGIDEPTARKRFERIKSRLRRAAGRDGLVPPRNGREL